MEIPPLSDAVARICARDKRYDPEAYLFLNDGLMETLQAVQKAEGQTRQISGAELSEGLRLHVIKEFGPLSLTVLNRWGIHSTRDFGEIVFVLLEAGLLAKTDEDRIEDFDNLYSFEEAFRKPFEPTTASKTAAASRPRKS